MSAFHALVRGNVQGVFFRSTTRDLAEELGLSGWVRNLTDGRLEVFAQGSEDELKELRRWLDTGPPHADVVGVETEVVPEDRSLHGFQVRRTRSP